MSTNNRTPKTKTQGNVGFTDTPIESTNADTLGVKKYADGLAAFIETCETPMTIAIQGDWGCGKTSMMNMVKKELEDKNKDIICIWFNTWQYSKFNLDDELALSLLKNLAKEIDDNNLKKVLNTLGAALKCTGKTALTGLGAVAAVSTGNDNYIGQMTDGITKFEEYLSNDNSDIANQLCKLKDKFQNAINKKCESDKNRVVIFIDDLDRLEPEKAVDLLEVLKLFLDCKNCVYVLAIDYNVVIRGVEKKYGERFKLQGRNFFDKIIQMPFKMPVLHYNIDNYIENLSYGLDILTSKKTDVKQKDVKQKDVKQKDVKQKIIKLIKASNSCNPRSIKRLFNTYKLELDINKTENIDEKIIIFACKCFELFFEDMYKKLPEIMPSVENGEELTDENYKNFKYSLGIDDTTDTTKDTFEKNLFEKLCGNMEHDDTNYINEFETFLESFCEVICNNDSLDKDRLAILYKIVATTDGVLYEYSKKLMPDELRDGCLCLKGKFAIDKGKDVTVKYKNKEYSVKTDNKYAGKLTELGKLYEDNSIKEYCKLNAKYVVSENTIYLTAL